MGLYSRRKHRWSERAPGIFLSLSASQSQSSCLSAKVNTPSRPTVAKAAHRSSGLAKRLRSPSADFSMMMIDIISDHLPSQAPRRRRRTEGSWVQRILVHPNKPPSQLQLLHQFPPVSLPDQPCSTVVSSDSLHCCSLLLVSSGCWLQAI